MAYLNPHDLLMSTLWNKNQHNRTLSSSNEVQYPSNNPYAPSSISVEEKSFIKEEAFYASHFGGDESVKTSLVLLLSLVFLIGVAGNLLTIFVLNKTKKGSRTIKGLEKQLTLLAAVDLLSSLTLTPLLIYLVITGSDYSIGNWKLGGFGCSVFPAYHQVVITFVEGILLLIAYERYTVIKKPFYQQNLPSQNILTWCFVIIFVAILISIPEASGMNMVEGRCLVVGSPAIRLTSAIMYSARDLLGLTLSLFLLKKASQLTNKHCPTFKSVESTKLTSIQRKAKIVWMVSLLTFLSVIPGDLFMVLRQSIVIQDPKVTGSDQQKKLIMVTGLLVILQVVRSCGNFIVYIFTYPRSFFLVKTGGCCISTFNNKCCMALGSDELVIDVVAFDTDVTSVSNTHHQHTINTGYNHQQSEQSSPFFPHKRHQLVVNIKDEYLSYMTETSSCSSSMF